MENCETIKANIISQEQELLKLQQQINTVQMEIMNKSEEQEELQVKINKNLEEQDDIELHNKQLSQDNENLLSMMQSYSKFYNEQIKDTENTLISKKVELANKLGLSDEYKKNIKRLQKKLIEILKNNQFFQLDFPSHPTFLTPTSKKSKSLANISQKNQAPSKSRCFSFEFRNEREGEPKESNFYYKMALVELSHESSRSKRKNKLSMNKYVEPQKAMKNETEGKTDPEVRRKTISVVMNHFGRSPSIILKFSNNHMHDFLGSRSEKSPGKDCEVWEKNILPLMKNKLNREKFKKEVQSLLKKHHIPNEDITRTYPKLSFSNQTQERDFFSELQQILEIFQFYRPDIGYIQGMSYIGAVFLFHMGKYRAFKAFCNLVVGEKFLRNLFSFNMPILEGYLKTFDHFLRETNPEVLRIFEEHSLSTEIFLYEWFYSLYARAFSLSTSTKIWDLLFAHGEIILFKTAYAICGLMESHLLTHKFDESVFFLRYCTDNLSEKDLIKKILGSKLSQEKFEAKLQKEAKTVATKKAE